jgi:hypothetical protein
MARKTGKTRPLDADRMRMLDDAEEAVAELRRRYEKYFLGIDRVAPSLEHDRVRGMVLRIKTHKINNTAWRYRMEQLVAAFIQSDQYWTRTLRQIEDGTYKRHRTMMLFRQGRARAEPPPPPVDIYTQYLDARRAAGLSAKISREKFQRTLDDQRAALAERCGDKRIEFEVAVKDGKPVLRARLR